jgi:hypothetical protein
MTLLEAIAEFAAVDHCSEADALVQVRKALADDMLICRWGDGFGYGLYGDTDWGEWWLKAKIRIPGDGKVLDNHMGMPDDDVLTGERPFRRVSRYRTLLIRRDSLSRLLSLITAPVAPRAAGPAESEAAPPSLSNASDEEVEAAYKQHTAEHGYQTEEQDLAWGELRGVKQAEVRALRQRHPRKTGRPRKKGRPKRG